MPTHTPPLAARLLLALAACLLAACAGSIGPPAGGTPYGLEERSHGHP